MFWNAIKPMKNRRIAGSESVPAELLKNGTKMLCVLCAQKWRNVYKWRTNSGNLDGDLDHTKPEKETKMRAKTTDVFQ